MPNPLAIYQDTSNPLAAGTPTLADAADWHRQNLADAWSAARDPATWQDAAQQYGNALLGGSIAPEAKGLKLDAAAMQVLREMTPGFRAYHGSPHSFDAFDTAKIGTGEGAQAYGHGLYFADNEGVARSYRDSLSPPGVVVMRGGEPVGPLPNSHIVNDPQFVAAYNGLMPDPGVPGWIKSAVMRDIGGLGYTAGGNIDLGGARKATIERMTKEMAQFSPEAQQRTVASVNQAYDSIGGDVQFRRPGHMYEVQVNADPAHFLDWDKPRDQQPQKVQDFISKNYPDVWDKAADGSSLYQHLARWASDNPKAFPDEQGYVQSPSVLATHILREGGIPGIRYLDGGSRAGGEGSKNTVVFDPATIAILRKYGIAGLMAGGTAAASGGQSQ